MGPQFDLLAAMEACRPSHDDAADPLLAPLAAAMAGDPQLDDRYQRQQRLDVALGGALQDVPLPDGLAGRLLQALATAREPKLAAVTAPAPPAARLSGGFRRRRAVRGWGFAAAGVAAAALIFALMVLEVGRHDSCTPQFVLEQAVNLFAAAAPGPAWPVAQKSPPATFPLSSVLRESSDVRWRPLHGFLDRAGVAYELTAPGGGRATLYVVHRSVLGAPNQPPAMPAHQTGSWSAAIWQQDGLLYVLVVQGDSRAYGELLDLPSGPVT